MESRYPLSWSNGYQEPNANPRYSRSFENDIKMNEMASSLSDPFLNNNSTKVNNDASPFQNCSTSFIDSGVISTYTPEDDFDQHLMKQYNQLAESKQNFGDDMQNPNHQNSLQVNMSSGSLSCNSETYDHTTFLDKTQKNHSNNLTQSISPSRGHSSISGLSYLQPDMGAKPSGHQSLSFNQSCFNTTTDSNRSTSLASINNNFYGGPFEFDLNLSQFQGHRRTPSEYSDVSAASLQHSPNLTQQNFLDQQNSPLQVAQDPASYQDVLAIGKFSLSDPQNSSVQSTRSPSHSPAISPRLTPQRLSQDNLLLDSGASLFRQDDFFSQEPFPSLLNEKGQAHQMIPPEINVEFVSMSRQNTFDSSKPNLFDRNSLTPTDKVRRRALTDTSSGNSNLLSRPRNASCFTPRYGPNLSTHSPDTFYSLSPNSETRNSSPNRIRRRSTPAMPNRDYTINLTDSIFQPVPLERNKLERSQKHPATYQCHLCPKKFTRAYNLRSHLRTHTNERPFICSKCSKAFARQHDRKRHESLHSGEKRFVCRGDLKNGRQWGCGRPFARADALNRHFRSEAGRICITPLIEEDESEKLRLWNERQIQNLQTQPVISSDIDVLSDNFSLPAALLAQYPALATYSWTNLSQGDGVIEDNCSGRSSFDASGSEYYE